MFSAEKSAWSKRLRHCALIQRFFLYSPRGKAMIDHEFQTNYVAIFTGAESTASDKERKLQRRRARERASSQADTPENREERSESAEKETGQDVLRRV